MLFSPLRISSLGDLAKCPASWLLMHAERQESATNTETLPHVPKQLPTTHPKRRRRRPRGIRRV